MKPVTTITEILVLLLFGFLTGRSAWEVAVNDDMSVLTPMLAFGGITLLIVLYLIDNKINPNYD